MVTLVRYLQPANAEDFISSVFFPTLTEPTSVFLEKADEPIVFTVSGTDTEVAMPVYSTRMSSSI